MGLGGTVPPTHTPSPLPLPPLTSSPAGEQDRVGADDVKRGHYSSSSIENARGIELEGVSDNSGETPQSSAQVNAGSADADRPALQALALKSDLLDLLREQSEGYHVPELVRGKYSQDTFFSICHRFSLLHVKTCLYMFITH